MIVRMRVVLKRTVVRDGDNNPSFQSYSDLDDHTIHELIFREFIVCVLRSC